MMRKPIRRKIVVPKNCFFCNEKKESDYKDVQTLEKYLSERGKILAKSRTGTCLKHQKRLARSVKRARFLALLPFTTSIK